MGLFDSLGDISMGYLARQREVQDKEAEDAFKQNQSTIGNLSKFWTAAMEGSRNDPEVQQALLSRIAEISQLDPRKVKPKDIQRLADASLLWQGVKRSPESMQPKMDTMQAQVQAPPSGPIIPLPQPTGLDFSENMKRESTTPLPGQRSGMQQAAPLPLNLESNIPLPSPPTEYMSVYPSQDELDFKKYGQAQAANEQELANYRRKKQIDQEYATKTASSSGGVNIPGTIPGASLIGENETDTAGNPIDPDVQYRVRINSDQSIASIFPASSIARAGEWMRDVDSSSGWARVYRSPAGKITSVERNLEPPSGYQTTVRDYVQFVPQENGDIAAIPVRSTSARVTPGAAAPTQGGGIITPPAPPGSAPTAAPTPAAPPRAGVQGSGQIVGARLSPIPVSTQDELQGIKTAHGLVKAALPQIQASKSWMGPGIGRLVLADIEHLGGKFSSPQQHQLAINLKNLLMSRAFAEGGKNLTGTELQQFTATIPSATDTIELAISKAEQQIALLDRIYKDKVSVMSKSQQRQISPTIEPPNPNGATGGGQRIEQRNKANGTYRHSLDGGKTWKTGKLPQ